MTRCAVGIDFGTLSARAVVAEIGTGRILADHAVDYPHGVMDAALPDGTRLRPDWALQDPMDYRTCLFESVAQAVKRAGVRPEDVVGLGLDVTSSTVLPVDKEGVPLCTKAVFRSDPYAWMMPWKHHGATAYAERMQRAAEAFDPDFLRRYGGRISSEWMLPKLWQVAEEAPRVFDAADRYVEAGDWLVYCLTGRYAPSRAMAGYKAFAQPGRPWPDRAFLKAVSPRLEALADKLPRETFLMGERAGGLTAQAAEATGLLPGTPVAVANIDAHVSMPAIGTAAPGSLLMIMGTSTCHILVSGTEKPIPGISGVVKDGVFPGSYGYEAGQSCCGDHFKWMFENALSEEVCREAREKGVDVHALLTERAARLRPGESGLLALDWWNGNRSILTDMELSGLMIGMTLSTRPEEIYRALIEATAYGSRVIVENFEQNGIPVKQIYACGGIARKNGLMMQIYADVLGRSIGVARASQAPALGSAIFGAVAAGGACGGYDTIDEAVAAMGGVEDTVYAPDPSARRIYEGLYGDYLKLHDLFGRSGSDVMHRLRRLRNAVRTEGE
ncbi:MAG: ribulokinase [Clostridiales bacterium]|nr:ribulokinase [Clostridiales bacterium]